MDARSSTSEADLKAQLFEAYERLNPQPEPRQLWLQWLMLVTLVAVLMFSIIGFVVSGIVLGGTTDIAGVALGQSFVLFASLLAIIYIILHILNARKDYPMDRKQAFQHPLQSWAVIVARIDVIIWAIALVASSIILAKADPKRAGNVRAIQANVVACVAGLPATGIALAVLETARYPFTLPWITPDSVITCRISALEYDMFDDSVSQRGSMHRCEPVKEKIRGPRPIIEKIEEEKPRRVVSKKEEKKKQERKGSLLGPRTMPEPVLEEVEVEVEEVHQQPPPVHQRPGDWKSQWNNLAEETGYNSIASSPNLSQFGFPWQQQPQQQPAVARKQSSSSLRHKPRGPLRRPSKIGKSSQNQNQSQNQQQQQQVQSPAQYNRMAGSTVSMSSAASSNYSQPTRTRRSPLSVMRTADDPNTVIQSDIRLVASSAGSSTYTTASFGRSETMSSADTHLTRPSTSDSAGSLGLFNRAAERLKAHELDSKAVDYRDPVKKKSGRRPPAPTVEDEVRIPGSFVED